MSQPTLKLTYFNATGRAELPRLIFNYASIPFEDVRIDGPQFGALKPTLPLGQVPTLEVDGVVYSQSMAISRYAAKLAGLYPQSPVDALRADMISDTFDELGGPLVDICFHEKDEAVKAEKTKVYVEETLPKAFKALETMVQGKFFLGELPTFADLQLFDVVINKLKVLFPTFNADAYPKLSAVVANVQALPSIAAYLSK